MGRFSELFLNEEKEFEVYFTDPMGNEHRLTSKGRLVNEHGVPKGISAIQYMVSQSDVTDETDETGNSGTKHYNEYLMKRVNQATKKSTDNESFAKELNKILGVKYFTANVLFNI